MSLYHLSKPPKEQGIFDWCAQNIQRDLFSILKLLYYKGSKISPWPELMFFGRLLIFKERYMKKYFGTKDRRLIREECCIARPPRMEPSRRHRKLIAVKKEGCAQGVVHFGQINVIKKMYETLGYF